jgi:hypothetical protein
LLGELAAKVLVSGRISGELEVKARPLLVGGGVDELDCGRSRLLVSVTHPGECRIDALELP